MTTAMGRVLMGALGLVLVGALLAACGDEGQVVTDADAPDAPAEVADTDAGDGSGAGPMVVSVVMDETEEAWTYRLDRTEVPAGEVTFQVTNEGQFEHELMIYPLQDLSQMIEELVEAEEASGGDAHAEGPGHAEEIHGLVMSTDGHDELMLEPGESATFTANLTPGSYELGCLIVETVGGETFTHHQKGMHASLLVGEA